MAFLSNQDNKEEVMSEINVTPLVDVMLVLLIIFILTVPVLTHSVSMELPKATSTPNEIKPDVVTLSITKDNNILWDNKVISESQLQEKLVTIATQQPQPEIEFRADHQVEYGRVVRIMATAQKAGIEKLGFITQPTG